MRKLNLVLIVIFSLIALIITAVIVGGIVFQNAGTIGIIGGADGPASTFMTDYSGSRDLLLEKTFTVDEIESVELALSSETVDIYEAEDDQFRVVQYGLNLENDRILSAEKTGSALVVGRAYAQDFRVFNFGINQQSWVELYIPSGYREDLDIQMSSGSLRAHCDLTLSDFYVKMSSGSFKNNGAIAAENVFIRVTSGSMRLERLDSAQFEIELSSGNVSVNQLFGSGTAQLTSGTLRLDNVSIDDSLVAKASSGTISIGLADDPSLRFHGSASSGSIKTYFDLYYADDRKRESFATVGEGPYKELDIQITSGTVRVTSVGGSEKTP